MHSNYNIAVIKQLRDQQVRYAPREKKIEQVNRAETLLAELDPQRTYSYEYLCYRITDYRPDTPHNTMSGIDAHHDLRLFVEDVSDSADIRAEDAGEKVHTVDDLSQMFNVSTKTISRWRQQGLISRRFIFKGRKRVGFLSSSVARFVDQNQDRVQRGERFSQLNEDERVDIIEHARRLAMAGGGPSEVARRIAKKMKRSVETIRYTLKQFDAKHPEMAIFPDARGPLNDELKAQLYQFYRQGTSVDMLAKKYGRTRSSIHRIVNDIRSQRIAELPLDFMPNDEFAEANERVVLGPMPESETASRKTKVPAGLPHYLASLYDVPLLNREQEGHMFRKYNYLKCKASRLRKDLESGRTTASLMGKIEDLYSEAVKTKNQIVKANLRLVVSIAKRHVSATDEFFGLVSDGNMSLIRAVEKFDYARGNKFSTYASWAIMKNFARTIPDEYKQRDRFRTSHDEMFQATQDVGASQIEQETAQRLREQQISKILDGLDEREQQIIISRFGLDHRQEPQTLKEVGANMGVTKERVRQIEARALNKLRQAARDQHIDLPE